MFDFERKLAAKNVLSGRLHPLSPSRLRRDLTFLLFCSNYGLTTAACTFSSLIFATGRDPTSGLLGHEFEKVNEGFLGFRDENPRTIQQSIFWRQCDGTSVSKIDTERNNLLFSPSECDVAVRDGDSPIENREFALFSLLAD